MEKAYLVCFVLSSLYFTALADGNVANASSSTVAPTANNNDTINAPPTNSTPPANSSNTTTTTKASDVNTTPSTIPPPNPTLNPTNGSTNTSGTMSTTMKTIVTTTVATNNSSKIEPTKTTEQARGFDGGSFVGGIILTLGVLIIGFMGFKYYQKRQRTNYNNF